MAGETTQNPGAAHPSVGTTEPGDTHRHTNNADSEVPYAYQYLSRSERPISLWFFPSSVYHHPLSSSLLSSLLYGTLFMPRSRHLHWRSRPHPPPARHPAEQCHINILSTSAKAAQNNPTLTPPPMARLLRSLIAFSYGAFAQT